MPTSILSQTTTYSTTFIRMSTWYTILIKCHFASGPTIHGLTSTIPALERIGFAIVSGSDIFILAVSCRYSAGTITNWTSTGIHNTFLNLNGYRRKQ